MANFANLKSAIQQVVKTNGNNEITGALLQQSLLAMIDSLGAGFEFVGIATPSTNPGTPDQNVYYIASTAGTYSNFGGIVLGPGEVAILTYNGSWTKNASGFASQQKVGTIERQMDGFFEPSNLYVINNHAYSYSTGTYTAINNYHLTGEIKIDQIRNARADGIKILSGKFGIGNQSYLGIVFFNSNGELMLSESQAADTQAWNAGQTFPASSIPESAVYVRFCCFSVQAVTLIIDGYGMTAVNYGQDAQNTTIAEHSSAIKLLQVDGGLLNKNLYTNRQTVNQSGTLITPANYWGTDLLPIDKIENARVDGIRVLDGLFGVTQVYCGVAFYTESFQFMATESVALLGNTYDINNPLPASAIPETAKYVKLSRYSQQPVKLVLDGCGFDTLFFKAKDIHKVVDSLVSDSATDGLSAKQGSVLLDKLKLNWEPIDVSDLTSIPMVISTTPDNGVYKWLSNRSSSQQISYYRHTRIKVKKGDKFFVRANASNPFSYAWLTSYEATYNQAAPLVTGTVPMSVPAGDYIFLEAPDGAEFLYMRRALSGVSGTELLPASVMRLVSYDDETAVPVSLMNCTYDGTTGKIISSSGAVVRTIKVTQGDIIRFSTSYTDSNNAGRPIYLGFSHVFPNIGASVTPVDISKSYAAKVTYNDLYVAPFDGYFVTANPSATAYYKNYSFRRVLTGADATRPLRNEKILVFGDSILSFKDSYANGRGFVEFLAQYLGAIVIRGSIGGTRLIPRASGAFRAFDISNLIHSWVTNNWTDVDAALVDEPSYADIINNLKAVRPEEITTIVMDGGGNDLSNPNLTFGDSAAENIFNENPTNDTLFGAINYIMRDLFTANPYLKIYWVNGLVGFAGSSVSSRTAENWVDNRSYTIDGQTFTSKEYRDKIYNQVSKWKIPLISMTNICINPITFDKFFYDSDNTHPYKGFYRMASIVASQLIALHFQ